jgi:large subunit ribosomal protein L3
MLDTIIGIKKKMGQSFIEGTRIPVTFVKAGPCVVTQVKSKEKDGYWAVQLGYGQKRTKNITKPEKGHLRGVKSKKSAPRFLREVRLNDKSELKVGDEIKLSDIFKKGDLVAVTGIGKGKGFAGVVKRWKFKGGPRTHGQSDRLRAPGSIGQGTTPGRVRKGKKMAGRMGSQRITIKNLAVVDIDTENDEIVLSGPVPGNSGGLIIIKRIAAGSLEDLIEEAPQEVVQLEKPEEEEKEAGSEG